VGPIKSQRGMVSCIKEFCTYLHFHILVCDLINPLKRSAQVSIAWVDFDRISAASESEVRGGEPTL
jgi:hypothetical protein